MRDELTPEAADTLLQHLDNCLPCLQKLETLAGGTGWLPKGVGNKDQSALQCSERLGQLMRSLSSHSEYASEQVASAPSEPLAFLEPAHKEGLLGLLGNYEVLEEVDRGGMGIVLKARDPALNRIVAIKALSPALAHHPSARARFLREARAAAAVAHENVMTIHAVEEFRETPYLVMQFIAGKSLKDRIRQSAPMPVVEIVRIAYQIADGLAAAHRLGLIHRDIKPSNILLENSVERVKITDFGLARAADDSSLTHAGHIAGTPEYMSPEQAQGESADSRADLFSLGCVMYEMATGISPFQASTVLGAMRKVCDTQPLAANRVNPAVPEWLANLINRLLEKDRSKRGPAAEKLAAILGERLATLQNPSQSVSPELSGSASAPAGVFSDQPDHSNFKRVATTIAILSVIGIMAVWLFGLWRQAPDRLPNGAGVEPLALEARFALVRNGGAEDVFTSLKEAIRAAPSGAIVECQFNGAYPVEAMDLGTNALTLRAGTGFTPWLSQREEGSTMFTSRGTLVLEGLTFKGTPPAESRLNPDNPASFRAAFARVAGASFFAAHCRFEFVGENERRHRPIPSCVSLEDCPRVVLFGCEFRTGYGCVIDWLTSRQSEVDRIPGSTLIENCTQYGVLLALERDSRAKVSLTLRRSTLARGIMLFLIQHQDFPPITIDAADCIFDGSHLIWVGGEAKRLRPDRLFNWSGRKNLFSLEGAFLQASHTINSFEAWQELPSLASEGSLPMPLEISERLNGLKERDRKLELQAFTLTGAERAAIEKVSPGLSESAGVRLDIIGPGAAYDQWKTSPAYAVWREDLMQPANGK